MKFPVPNYPSPQFLNRSVASSVNVVDTLAAFGLAYVFVKLFVGMLQEVKQVGVVLVHDRPGFHKLLLCVVIMGIAVTIIIVVIGECMPHLNYYQGECGRN